MKFPLAGVCLSLCALTVVGGDAPKTGAKIDGSWTLTRASDGGDVLPPEVFAGRMMVTVFKDGKYTMSVKGNDVEKGTYTIDTTKTPSTFDQKVTEGQDAGKTIMGIVKIDGDKLAIATHRRKGNAVRPKTFEPTAGVQVQFFERKK